MAGRAGRSILGGKVIVQTYSPDHPAIQAASRHDYTDFYGARWPSVASIGIRPSASLSCCATSMPIPSGPNCEAKRLHRQLTHKIARLGLPDTNLIGPAPSFFPRERGKWRWQIIVRGSDPCVLLRDMRLPLGWRIDVDPVSLL